MKFDFRLRLLFKKKLFSFKEMINIKNQKGFTLIELISVIVILGIMAVVASPFLSSDLTATRTKEALEDVRSASRYCQRYAMETQRWCRVLFRTSDEEVRLQYSTDEANNASWTQMDHPTNGGQFVVQLGQGEYAGIDITATDINGSNSIVFDGNGIPRDRGTVGNPADLPAPITSTGTITFNGGGGWELQVEPETGFITLVDI